MNRRVAVIMLLTVVVMVIVGAPNTMALDGDQWDTTNAFGTAISSFMQVSVVETESTVDRMMWQAAFEHADNDSERRKLLKQRAEALSEELSAIQEKRKRIGGNSVAAQVRAAAINAEITELRISINNASTTANESDIDTQQFAKLRTEVCSVDISTNSSIVNVSALNATGLNCPPQQKPNGNTSTVTATETPNGTTVTNTSDGPANTTANGTQVPPIETPNGTNAIETTPGLTQNTTTDEGPPATPPTGTEPPVGPPTETTTDNETLVSPTESPVETTETVTENTTTTSTDTTTTTTTTTTDTITTTPTATTTTTTTTSTVTPPEGTETTVTGENESGGVFSWLHRLVTTVRSSLSSVISESVTVFSLHR